MLVTLLIRYIVLAIALCLSGCSPESEIFGIYIDSFNVVGRPSAKDSGLSLLDMAYYHFKRMIYKGEMSPQDLLRFNTEYSEKSALYFGENSLQFAGVLADVGVSYMAIGGYKYAIAYLSKARDISLGVAGNKSIAFSNATGNLGQAYYMLGMYHEALDSTLQSLAALEGVQGRDEYLSAAYNNIGNAYSASGDTGSAIAFHRKALSVTSSYYGEGSWAALVQRANLAINLHEAGYFEEAVGLLNDGLDILKRSRDKDAKKAEPDLLVRLSRSKLGLHDYLGAYEAAQSALEIKKSVYDGNKVELLEYLNNLFMVSIELGNRQEVLAIARQGEEIASSHFPKNSPPYAHWLSNLAYGYYFTGDKASGRRALLESITIYDNNHDTPPDQIYTNLNTKVTLSLQDGDINSADAYAKKAISYLYLDGFYSRSRESTLLSTIRDIEIAKENLAARGKKDPHKSSRHIGYRLLANLFSSKHTMPIGAYRSNLIFFLQNISDTSNDNALRIFLLKMAVNTLQADRASVALIDRNTLNNYTDLYRNTYTTLATLLSESNRASEAFLVLSMLKEEEFYEFTRRGNEELAKEKSIPMNKMESNLNDSLTILEKRTSLLSERLDQIKSLEGNDSKDASLEKSLEKQLSKSMDDIENTLEAFANSSLNKPSRNGYVQSMANENNDIHPPPSGDSAILVYWVSDDSLNILIRSKTVNATRSTAIDEDTKRLLGPGFSAIVSNVKEDPKPAALKVYNAMVKPIEDILRANHFTTLAISLHGSLRYIPMAALYDGEKYLVERYSLPLINGAHLSKTTMVEDKGLAVSAMGVSKPIPPFPPLPHVKDELQSVAQGIDSSSKASILLDDSFTRRAFEESVQAGFNVIHIATHYSFSPGTEENSFLLLGDGSKLTLADIREANLKLSNVRLVSLSACETGRGGGFGLDGREIDGLSGVIQQKGAQAVLATLWPVADLSTSEVMKSLYHRRFIQRLPLAESLRESQLDLLLGRNRLAQVDGQTISNTPNKSFTHPFYWAPFFISENQDSALP